MILRWYNLAGVEQELALTPHFPVEAIHASDILERRKQQEALEAGTLRHSVGKAQIVTYALKSAQS